MGKTVGLVIMMLSALAMADSAEAQWREVNYTGTLRANMPYCGSQRDLDKMVDYVIDGDDRQLNRLIETGKCRVSARDLRVSVFQQNESQITFLTPSGNVFRTLRSFLK